MDWSKHQLLVVAPHPDDEAIGCGGLINRVNRAGGQVFVLWMTIADIRDFSDAGLSTAEQRRREMAAAADFWPLAGWHLALPDPQYNLRLDTVPQGELIDLIERGNHPLSLADLRPTAVAIPDPASYNQDHAAAATAAVCALRPGPNKHRHQPDLVLGYEEIGDDWTGHVVAANPTFYVQLTAADLDRKIDGLRLHASQWRNHPHTRSEQALRGLASVRGAQSGYPWAEAYRCLRWRSG